MTQCAICEEELSADTADQHCDSEEHIFPNSVGGYRTVSGFLCRKCNSGTGETWDAALAKQMQPLCLMLGVSRDRGATPPLKTTTTKGERITLSDQGGLSYTDPEFERRERSDGSTEYSIKARSVNEARRMLHGLKRKHPELDVEAALAQATGVEKYLDGDCHFSLSFGGSEAGRSMVKTCLAFAYASGVDWRDCKHATSYLRDPKANACFGYYSDGDLVSGRRPGVPLHCVGLCANPQNGLIIGYAEYFGVLRIVACLGEGYQGNLVKEVYAFNPQTGDQLNVDLSLNFDRETMEAIYSYEHYDGRMFEESFSAVLGPALQARTDAEKGRVVERAIDNAFQNCGAKPGELLTEDHIRRISHSVAESITPFLMQQLRGVERPSEG